MILAAILVAAFVAGAFAGVLILVRVAMIRDKCGRTLPGSPQTTTAAAGRLVTGLYVRRPEPPARVEYATAQIITRPRQHLPAIPAAGAKDVGRMAAVVIARDPQQEIQ
jgi:hypothetical protein